MQTTTLFCHAAGTYFADVPIVSGTPFLGNYIVLDVSDKRFTTENFPNGLTETGKLVAYMRGQDYCVDR
jgi:hypothetical protein